MFRPFEARMSEPGTLADPQLNDGPLDSIFKKAGAWVVGGSLIASMVGIASFFLALSPWLAKAACITVVVNGTASHSVPSTLCKYHTQSFMLLFIDDLD